MPKLLPLRGLLKNLKQEIPEHSHRLYLTRQQAYESLKRLTGQDFGDDIDAWQRYLTGIGFDPANIAADDRAPGGGGLNPPASAP